MGFTRFVEIGRVAIINYGPDSGKLVTILDVVDAKRVLVDGPQSITGIHRQVVSVQRLSLTDIVVTGLTRGAKAKKVLAGWKDQDVMAKWQATAWSKKIDSKKKRAAMGDFDRFKLMIAKKQKSKIISDKLTELSS